MTMAQAWHAKITATGSAFPERVFTNADFEKMVDTSDAWIRERTGIVERRILGPNENNSDLGERAARVALKKAGLLATELDLIIYATCTPDKILPATACMVQARLGATRAAAFDLEAACAGWLVGVSIADQYIRSGMAKHVLVIGAEALSRFINFSDRNTCVLFGDGAGAAILSRANAQETSRIFSTHMLSDGNYESILDVKIGGSACPLTADNLESPDRYIAMKGKEVFKLAVRAMVDRSLEALSANGFTAKDVDWIIPHQANIRIVQAIGEKLEIPLERTILNLDRYGNTSAATIPTALDEAVDTKKIKRGDLLLLVTFGGGLTSAAAVLRW